MQGGSCPKLQEQQVHVPGGGILSGVPYHPASYAPPNNLL
jgi:hypothetical protein